MASEPSASSAVLLTPAALLPVQLARGAALDASVQPEKRLMLAVLEEAVATFQRTARDPGRRGRRLHHEAADWFASADASWPYAYHNVCETLGIEAEWLRQGLWQWRDLHQTSPETVGRPCQPFRRVCGSRTRATGRPIGLRRTA